MPFLSVTGSDFMEMFVGVGASRVGSLQSARKWEALSSLLMKLTPSGAKEALDLEAGMTSEQTLNQMLAEMDGFEATEGIVMMVATNRPDILDPALLGTGRFIDK